MVKIPKSHLSGFEIASLIELVLCFSDGPSAQQMTR